MRVKSIVKTIQNKYTLLRIVKRAYYPFMPNDEAKRLVFVVGSQRSGTTALMRCFERDLRSRLFGEIGFSDQKTRRLRPFSEIEDIVARQRAAFIVVKPLRESQRVSEMLDYFPKAKAVWMYRHHHGVARSRLQKWGVETARKHLRPFVDGKAESHWASEGASQHTHETVKRLFSQDTHPNDVAALVWYVRNQLFFDLDLANHPRVMLCKYEDMVSKPNKVLQKLYCFFDYPYPGDRIVKHIHAHSVNVAEFELSQPTQAICADLLQKMDQVYISNDNSTYTGSF